MSDIDAVLFDFDGTLAPNLDLPGMRKRVVELTRDEGVPETAFAGQYIVETVDSAAQWLTENRDRTAARRYFEQAHQIILDIETRAAADTQPFPGVQEKLRELRARGLRLGVVTRNCRSAVLEVYPGLLEDVDALHARDDVTHLKPNLRHLMASLAALGCESTRAAMVGDGQLDMRAGAALNMHCVGVLTGSGDHASLLAAGATEVLASCLELSL